MIILVAVCAAIYELRHLFSLKPSFLILPGFTEVRVGNIFSMVFGILFGPAGAWGTGIGNLIGDVFGGTLGPTSIAGFVRNLLLGYLPYTMWLRFTLSLKITGMEIRHLALLGELLSHRLHLQCSLCCGHQHRNRHSGHCTLYHFN